jgi:hypothetical protein
MKESLKLFKFVWGLKNEKPMKKKYLVLAFLFYTFCSVAQSIPSHCGTTHYLNILKAEDPLVEGKLQAMEVQTQEYISRHKVSNSSVIVIPVVFHIVYNTPAQNLPDGVIREQMVMLNADYAKMNSDTSNVPAIWKPIAANTQIQFRLADFDTLGNPTTGIIHTSSANTTFANSPSDHKINFATLGGANAWNRNHYLNIWVCNLGSGILGYTQLPGVGPATRDGCVINYIAVGKTGATAPYNLGRTITHEVGHWLNLDHTWGDDYGYCTGTDYVADTPNEANANYSNYPPFTVKLDSCSPAAPGFMWQNYMDYTDDAGMCLFTAGQVQRMQATLNGPRDSIRFSPAVWPAAVRQIDLNRAVSVYPSPSTGTVYLKFNGISGKTGIRVFDISGNQVYGQVLESSDTAASVDLSGFSGGIYFFEIKCENSQVYRKIVLIH